MKESITCPTQNGTLKVKSVPPIAGHSAKWHRRSPANLLLDNNVSDVAKTLFGILSLKTYQGNVSTLGIRKLAELSGKSKSSVHRAIQELSISGQIQPVARQRGQRGYYVLTSEVFAQKQGKKFEVVSYPRKRLVSVEVVSA